MPAGKHLGDGGFLNHELLVQRDPDVRAGNRQASGTRAARQLVATDARGSRTDPGGYADIWRKIGNSVRHRRPFPTAGEGLAAAAAPKPGSGQPPRAFV